MKAQGTVIGYAYVVGDILHAGHLRHLRNCKGLCDKLIVGVLTDEAVMEKKPLPAVRFEERIEMIGALDCVDAAVAQDTYSPLPNILEIKPNILFESTSHQGKSYPEFEGRIIVMPYYPSQSSSNIKNKIKQVKE